MVGLVGHPLGTQDGDKLAVGAHGSDVGGDALVSCLGPSNVLLIPVRTCHPSVHWSQRDTVPHDVTEPSLRVEDDALQLGVNIHASFAEVGAAQVCSVEVGAAEVRIHKASAAQSGTCNDSTA